MKIIMTLDSLLDTRRPLYNDTTNFLGRVIDSPEVQELYAKRDKDILKNVKETNIGRLLILVRSFNDAYVEANKMTEDVSLTLNTYPYLLNDSEIDKLYTVLKVRYRVDRVVYEEPCLEYFKYYDVVIDYDGLANLDRALSTIKDINANVLHGLMETKLIVPKLFFSHDTLEDLLLQVKYEELDKYFEQMMREYEPLVGLEMVDIDFFNNAVGLYAPKEDKEV